MDNESANREAMASSFRRVFEDPHHGWSVEWLAVELKSAQCEYAEKLIVRRLVARRCLLPITKVVTQSYGCIAI